jgi:hypothetical protein
MSQREPDRPYAYQPDPAKSVEDKAWAVSGPGTEKYQGKRYTKAEAESLAEQIHDSQQNAWFERMVVVPFRREVIHSLLSGNDTLSFTTAQYKARYHEIAAETFKTGQPTIWQEGQAEQQLRLSGLVWEARPGLWVSVAESTKRA